MDNMTPGTEPLEVLSRAQLDTRGVASRKSGALSGYEADEPYVGDPSEPPATISAAYEPSPLRCRLIYAAICIVLALVSLLGVAPKLSDEQTYQHQISVLDEKKANVMGLVAASTAGSAAISLLPDDAGSAIANKLADLSSYLMVILCVIYLEKFLITLLGGLGFGVLVPLGLLVMGVAQLVATRMALRQGAMRLATRALVFGVAISLVVPASVWVTDRVDATYEQSLASQAEAQDQEGEQNEQGSANTAEEAGEGGIFASIGNFLQDSAEAISGAVQDSLDSLTGKLNELVDRVAVMIVTSCLIPILVLAVFLWLARVVCGIATPATGELFAAASAAGRKTRASLRATAARGRAKIGRSTRRAR